MKSAATSALQKLDGIQIPHLQQALFVGRKLSDTPKKPRKFKTK